MGMAKVQRNSNKSRTRRNKVIKRVAAFRHQARILNNKLSFEKYLSHKRFEEKPDSKLTAREFEKRYHCEDHVFIFDQFEKGIMISNSRGDSIIFITDSMWEQFEALKTAKTG
jgi:hypothetical protein